MNNQIDSGFMPATDLKIGTFVLIPNFNTQTGISKKLQPLRKGPYQIIDKPTEVTYKSTDSNKKEIVQHRNNLLPKRIRTPRFNSIIFFNRLTHRSKQPVIPNFNTQTGISKKLHPLRKGPYQIIDKPTEVTYKSTDSNKKEIVQHRNNLLPKRIRTPRFNSIIFFNRFTHRSKQPTNGTKSKR